MQVEAYAATDIGPVRDNNEDAWLIDLDGGLLVVADGMGGFRISVSLAVVADGIPDFVMRFDSPRRTFVVARGSMAMVVMDMRAAVRPHGPSGEGLIKHGTVRTPKTNCPFVVFDVEADSWERSCF